MNRGFKIFTGAALGLCCLALAVCAALLFRIAGALEDQGALCRQALQLLAEAPLESGREEASSEAPVDVGEFLVVEETGSSWYCYEKAAPGGRRGIYVLAGDVPVTGGPLAAGQMVRVAYRGRELLDPPCFVEPSVEVLGAASQEELAEAREYLEAEVKSRRMPQAAD